MILLIDNYDSFTWNLVQCMGVLLPGQAIEVVRNDRIGVEEALAMDPSHLVISPGPCTPRETGSCADIVRAFAGRIPMLGVCLGHQTIADVHGMVVRRHDDPMHGKTSEIHHDGRGIFQGLPDPFTATRYHSLIVERASVTSDFEISAWTDDGDVMGLRGKSADGGASIDGVQFHPESFLSRHGPDLVANFLGVPRSDAGEVGCVDHA